MNITDEMIRPLKLAGMTDMEVGGMYGVQGSRIKHLRHKFGIPSIRPEVKRSASREINDGWPVVMSEEQRVKHWARYFEGLGRDHGADNLTFRPTGRMMRQPDRPHGLGATSLVAMELF